jgi:hypothetical protein
LTTPLSFATYYYYVAFCPHIATGINERWWLRPLFFFTNPI